MFTWKIAAAFATGNTVVIKSAEAIPLSAALENYTETKAVYFNMGLTAPDAV
jgi:acyl-CoA reductase-like NAD-dependent aldehyde dehydrogenase